MINPITNVVLPAWCWEDASNNDDVKRNVLRYMQKYPGYKVLRVKNGMAICERE